jgi:hypothetical protein
MERATSFTHLACPGPRDVVFQANLIARSLDLLEALTDEFYLVI